MAGNLAALQSAPRCQAKSKGSQQQCQCPAVRGKRVCHTLGGARGSGAPCGAANGAFKHGGWTHEAVSARREASRFLKALARGG